MLFWGIFHKINHPAIGVLPLEGPRIQPRLLRRLSHPIPEKTWEKMEKCWFFIVYTLW